MLPYIIMDLLYFITTLENNKKNPNTQDTNGAVLSYLTAGITMMQNWKINFEV